MSHANDTRPDMTSVRESCVTSLRNRDIRWLCSGCTRACVHHHSTCRDDTTAERNLFAVGRTDVFWNTGKPLREAPVFQRRYRRIAGAVAGIATALTFLNTRFSSRLSPSLLLSIESRIRLSAAVHRCALILLISIRRACQIPDMPDATAPRGASIQQVIRWHNKPRIAGE